MNGCCLAQVHERAMPASTRGHLALSLMLSCSLNANPYLPQRVLPAVPQEQRGSSAGATSSRLPRQCLGSVPATEEFRLPVECKNNPKNRQHTHTQIHSLGEKDGTLGFGPNAADKQPSGTLSGRHPNLELCPEAFGAAVWLVLLVRRLLLDAAPSDGHVTARHKADICVDRTAVAAAAAADKPRPIEQREK